MIVVVVVAAVPPARTSRRPQRSAVDLEPADGWDQGRRPRRDLVPRRGRCKPEPTTALPRSKRVDEQRREAEHGGAYG